MAKDGPRIDLDMDSIFERANQTKMVRAKVQDRTAKIAARARRIDMAENEGRANIKVVTKTLGNGRFVGNVESDDAAGEFGDSNTKRRRTLRRAAGSR